MGAKNRSKTCIHAKFVVPLQQIEKDHEDNKDSDSGAGGMGIKKAAQKDCLVLFFFGSNNVHFPFSTETHGLIGGGDVHIRRPT